MGPQVSVVVPTYKRPHFLAQALASARQQSLSDIEILVCDNGADRETADVVRACGDERIHYIPRPQNLGMLRNAMLGFSQAQADLVMKLDDDDLLRPNALDLLSAPLIDDLSVGLSFGGVALIDEHNSPLLTMTDALDSDSGRATFLEGRIAPATGMVARGGVQLAGAMLRRDVVDWERVPKAVATAYDFYLALTAVEDGQAAYFVDHTVIDYRIHSGSDTQQRIGEQLLGACGVLERALTGDRHTQREELEKRLALVSLDAARVLTQQGRAREARSLTCRSRGLRPSLAAIRLQALTYAPSRTAAALTRARGQWVTGRPSGSNAMQV